MSCNFRQPPAGVGDLSSFQPSSSASRSYLWTPSKVNMLPQVQINSTRTKGLPLLPHLPPHTSPTTGEIRASLADLTAPQNTTLDHSLIAWIDPLSPPDTHTHTHTHIHQHYHYHYHSLSLLLAKKHASLFCTLN